MSACARYDCLCMNQRSADVMDIARRHRFSPEAVEILLAALASGGGGMAQFHHPELGGSGQWMRGGMLTLGDMWNDELKGRVNRVLSELT